MLDEQIRCPECGDPKSPRETFCRPCSLDMRCECGAEMVGLSTRQLQALDLVGPAYACPNRCGL